MVNFRENEWEWKGEKFFVKPGEVVTSLASIVKNAGKGISVRNVRTALARFEKLEFLTNKSTKSGRHIKIMNWDSYQAGELESDKESDKRVTKTRQRPDKDLTPIEECKKVKNDKNKEIRPDFVPSDLWKDFKEMRVKIKAPMTKKAEELAFGKLQKLKDDGEDIIKVIEQSIYNDWKGLFKVNNHGIKNSDKGYGSGFFGSNSEEGDNPGID